MAEDAYVYRAGRRVELEKAADVIGVSFVSGAPPPPACAFPDAAGGSTNLRRLAFLRPSRFGVFCLDIFREAHAPELRGRRDRAMEALRDLERTTFVSHGYRSDPSASGDVLVLTDEVVAEFPDLSLARLRPLLRARGVAFVRTLDRRRRVVVLRVTARAGRNALKVANRLVEEGLAAAAEPNFVRRLPSRGRRRPRRPSDPLLPRQWHLENTGRNGAQRGADARVIEAWTMTAGSPELTIAVVDDGVDLAHEEFGGKGKLLPGRNFEDGSDDVSAGPDDRHGTACAGIAIARSGNGRGGCGVAPKCRLLPVRTPDEWGEEVGYADALAWAADHGADVISCSWGPPDGYWSDDPLPLAVDAALERATTRGRDGRGCVIAWAAGNGNEPVDLDGFASDPRVLAVAASDDRDLKASYSDFGEAICVCAPSGDTARGRPGIWTTDLTGRAGYSRGSYTSEFSGTSAAAPLVAGVAALVLSVNPTLTWSEVKSVLEETAERIDAEGSFTDGRGATHSAAYVDGRSLCYGAGRVDAAAAVGRAEELRGAGRRR
ncbi:MAG: S8 family serine peptidase [Gemmatimonadota bacterium]